MPYPIWHVQIFPPFCWWPLHFVTILWCTNVFHLDEVQCVCFLLLLLIPLVSYPRRSVPNAVSWSLRCSFLYGGFIRPLGVVSNCLLVKHKYPAFSYPRSAPLISMSVKNLAILLSTQSVDTAALWWKAKTGCSECRSLNDLDRHLDHTERDLRMVERAEFWESWHTACLCHC